MLVVMMRCDDMINVSPVANSCCLVTEGVVTAGIYSIVAMDYSLCCICCQGVHQHVEGVGG